MVLACSCLGLLSSHAYLKRASQSVRLGLLKLQTPGLPAADGLTSEQNLLLKSLHTAYQTFATWYVAYLKGVSALPNCTRCIQ